MYNYLYNKLLSLYYSFVYHQILNIMLVYLLYIPVSLALYIGPDFSQEIDTDPHNIISVESYSDTIVMLSSMNSAKITVLDLFLNIIYTYDLQGRNTYMGKSLELGSNIYVGLEAVYQGDDIPGLLTSTPLTQGTTYALLIIFSTKLELVRTIIIGTCPSKDSSLLDLHLSTDLFILHTNDCDTDAVFIDSLNNFSSMRITKSTYVNFSISGNADFTYLIESDGKTSQLKRSPDFQTIGQYQENISQISVGDKIIAVADKKILKISLSGSIEHEECTSFALNSIVKINDSIYLMSNINSNVLDFSTSGNSIFLIEYSYDFSITNYRGFQSLNTVIGFLHKNIDYYFFDSNIIYHTINPFAYSSIENCATATKNILGEAFCSSCQPNSYLLANHCLPILDCPLGLQDPYTLACAKCFTGCETCNSTSSTSCLSCSENYNFYNNTCLINCPQGFYSSSGLCLKCSENCQSCNNSQCFSCNYGVLYNGTCQNDCPEKYFLYGGKCEECWENCQVCNEGGCEKCADGYYSNQGNCEKCLEGCVACDNTKCLICEYGFILQNNQCINTTNCEIWANDTCEICIKGFYYDNTIKKCMKCIENCKKCNKQECLECYENFTFVNNSCNECLGIVYNGTCVECPNNCTICENGYCTKCIDGYYFDNDFSLCKKCQDGCKTCENSKCLKCDTGVELNGLCVEKCGEGYENVTGNCIKCPENCASCFGYQCLSCIEKFAERSTFELINGVCLYEACLFGYHNITGICEEIEKEYISYLSTFLSLYINYFV